MRTIPGYSHELGFIFFYALTKGANLSYECNTFSYLINVYFKIRKNILATNYAYNVRFISKNDYCILKSIVFAH